MDIQSLRKIIFPAINKAVNQIEEDKLDYNITTLRAIMNEALNGSLNINHYNDTEMKGLFSGRGRAWARTDVDENNDVWIKIKEALTFESQLAEEGSKMHEACTNLLDTFENTGFAWMRFGRAKKGMIIFIYLINRMRYNCFYKFKANNVVISVITIKIFRFFIIKLNSIIRCIMSR